MKLRLAVLLSLAAACGSSSNSNNPDAGTTTITGITPTDGATKVSAYTTVTIQLSGDADAASISATTVRLYHGASKNAVSGTVTYDAGAQTITFTPNLPLQQTLASNSQLPSFRVDVNGVTAGGVALAEKTATFAILADPSKQALNVFPASTPKSILTWQHDASGNVTEMDDADPGPDGKLGTSDDVIQNYWAYDAASNGHKQARQYNAAGTDGQWHTADDVMDLWCDTTLGAGGDPLYVCYGDPGPDGKWFTADDVVDFYNAQTFDNQDRVTQLVEGDAGPDNVIGNADDDFAFYEQYHYDTTHDQPSETRAAYDAGADGVWFTADDQVDMADTIPTFDDHGAYASWLNMSAGPDGVLGTSDDFADGSSSITLDAHHAILQRNDNIDPGPDGKYGTADDVAGDYEKYTFDTNGVLTEDDQWNVGADNIPFNADDYAQFAESYDDSI